MKVAVIPARGGSKRVPRKNIKNFFGKPMISWSISAAVNSGLFDKIIVSSDDTEICNISRNYGAEVPFRRPKELSDDYTGTVDVIAHAIDWAIREGWGLKSVCCLYATAPFVMAEDLIVGLKELEQGGWDYTFSSAELPVSVFRSFEVLSNGGVQMFFPGHFESRSQDLPRTFYDAGQFYWATPEVWMEKRKIFSENSMGIQIPSWRVLDIDTKEDWERAELMAPMILG